MVPPRMAARVTVVSMPRYSPRTPDSPTTLRAVSSMPRCGPGRICRAVSRAVGEAIADAHDVLVRASLAAPDAGEAGRWKARRRRGLVRRARKDAARHLDRNARDRLDVPAKARNAAHWAEPDREVAQPPPPAAMSVEWLTQRRDPHAGARLAAPTLAAASAEFFPEHATLGATLATSLLRHREQAWRDAEEDYLSRLLTLAFCAFCGVADYAIMVH